MALILVRHAMPFVEPDVPTGDWRLASEGKVAARALRPLLPARSYFVASSEPKAIETLGELTDPADVVVDEGFREARRPWTAAGYRPLAQAYVDGADHTGWEPRAAVLSRFAAAVDRHAALASDRTLVIGTHGLALTLWLSSLMRLEGGPAGFWSSLRFPDLIEIDVAARRVVRRA